MRNLLTLLLTSILFIFLSACQSENQSSEQAESEVESETSTITLSPLEGSPAYADASLSLVSAEPGEGGNFAFSFEVQNYELGAQTQSASTNGLANSGKGQHIHLIVDNSPYSAHYEASFTTDKLKDPGNHVVLAFLSRSYHESVKNTGDGAVSFFVDQYISGDGDPDQADLTAPHMFYSRPKGTYSGEDINRVLLDFFLVNVDLSPDGYKIKASVNGEDFTITKWQPYVIEGLEPGDVEIRLELLDADGNAVDSPFNPVVRTVKLEAGEAN